MPITVKIFMPLSRLCTSDRVGISYRSRLIALLSGFCSRHAIALLSDDKFVNPVGWFVDICDDVLLLKVTGCLLQVVVPWVRDLPVVPNDWWNTAVHLDVVQLIVFADTGKDISVDFKEAVFRQDRSVTN